MFAKMLTMWEPFLPYPCYSGDGSSEFEWSEDNGDDGDEDDDDEDGSDDEDEEPDYDNEDDEDDGDYVQDDE